MHTVAEERVKLSRIQLNLLRKQSATAAIAQATGSLTGTRRAITQHNKANAPHLPGICCLPARPATRCSSMLQGDAT